MAPSDTDPSPNQSSISAPSAGSLRYLQPQWRLCLGRALSPREINVRIKREADTRSKNRTSHLFWTKILSDLRPTSHSKNAWQHSASASQAYASARPPSGESIRSTASSSSSLREARGKSTMLRFKPERSSTRCTSKSHWPESKVPSWSSLMRLYSPSRPLPTRPGVSHTRPSQSPKRSSQYRPKLWLLGSAKTLA